MKGLTPRVRPLRVLSLGVLFACSGSRSATPSVVGGGAQRAGAGIDAPTGVATGARAADFVWADSRGLGRAQVVWFRRDLRLDGPVEAARLRLFADSRYLLFVNGEVVEAGPARSYPEHPEYDEIDLSPHLHQGSNTLAVQVRSFGTSTFQQRRQPGGFIAWGSIEAREHGAIVQHDLATPGAWKCRRDLSQDATAPRGSFALPPIEVYDAPANGTDFLHGDLAGPEWLRAVPLEKQQAWGALAPRSIPPLERSFVPPRRLAGAYALDAKENILSFRVVAPDQSRAEYEGLRVSFARTKIFSPRKQTLRFGVGWGEAYLNGRGPLKRSSVDPERERGELSVPLHAGWNDWIMRHESVFGSWDFYLATAASAGLEFSPRGVHDDSSVFETAGPFTLSENAPPSAWRTVPRGSDARNPALEVLWRRLGLRLPLDPSRTTEIDLPAHRDTALVFDLGQTELGRVRIDYDAPSGTRFDLAWSEALARDGRAIEQRPGLYLGARQVAAGGAATFQTVTPYGLRYLQIDVSRQRAPVRIQRVGVVREVYPFDVRGSFESSDPELTALWQAGLRTLRVCAEDSYIDTPFRERALYAGDLLVEAAVTLVTSGDVRLVKRSLRLLRDMYADLFSGAPRHPDESELFADYPLLALETWKWMVDVSADLDLAREMFPAYAHLLDAVLSRRAPDGLTPSDDVFIEWALPPSERHESKNTAYQALLARALADLAMVADRLRLPERAARYRSAAQQVAAALQERLWDEAAGAYVDGIQAGTRSSSHLPISSAWPSLWGITSEDQELRLAAFWRTLFGPAAPLTPNTTPYGGFFVLGALYRHGHARLAEDYMRRYWAPMLQDPNATLWEHFERSAGSSSHAWSAAPTYYLSTEVLGVQLGYPAPGGLEPVTISPRAESLSWARGVVPHPGGDIGIDWRADDQVLHLSVRAAPGLRYRVIPRGRLGALRLELNGRMVEQLPAEGP